MIDVIADFIKNKTNKIEVLILQAIYELGGKTYFEDIFNLIGRDSENGKAIRRVHPEAALSRRGLRNRANQLDTRYKDHPLVIINRHHGPDRRLDQFKITEEGKKHVQTVKFLT